MTSLKKPFLLDFETQYGLVLDDADDAITVDLFAGDGGASTGLEMGPGHKVDLATNHNPAAISMREANHPRAERLPADAWGIGPTASTKGKAVGWLHVSSDCRHHSQAAGGQLRKKGIRDLSWAVTKRVSKPRELGCGPWVISLENVKQILQWGPLTAKRDKATGRVVRLDDIVAQPGERVPRHEQFLALDPKRKGRTWCQLLYALHGFGYQVDYWVECNCDYGDPTTRQRLCLVVTDGGFAPVAAEKTHAAEPSKGTLPYRTAAECIDWSDLGQPVRNRKKPLAEATMCRIAKGIEKEVLQHARPSIVPVTNWLCEAVYPADQPLNTVTVWPKGGASSVVTPTLTQVGYGRRDGQALRILELDEPPGTVVVGGTKHAVAAAYLVKFRFDATGSPIDEPTPVITSGGECKCPAGAAHALSMASVVLVDVGGRAGQTEPRSVSEPTYTITAKVDCGVTIALLVRMNGDYNTTFGRPADVPMSTVTNSGSQQQLVTTHLLHLRGNCDARAANEPLHTVSAGGQHRGLISALLVTNTTGYSSMPADQPVPIVATDGHYMLVTLEMIAGSLTPEQLDGAVWVAAFLVKHHGMGENTRSSDEPFSTVITKGRLALVTVWVSGSPYAIVDIRLRMSKSREPYRAQGFPGSYIIERGYNGQRFILSQQVHMCGNSVSPNTMVTYARANDPWKWRLRPSPQQVAA